MWVAWYDDGVLQLPGETEPTRELELEVGGDTARVTTIPTSGTIPQVTTLETEAGMLRLAVSGTPVFVELEP